MDAALLLIPSVGFVDYDDRRMVRTTDAIRDELEEDGLLRRFRTARGGGRPEGVFLPCSFWLADCLGMLGRTDEARALFERLLGLANDVGLLSEEYDPVGGRLLGNFPQAFTHVSLVNTAGNLSSERRPALHRATGEDGLGVSLEG